MVQGVQTVKAWEESVETMERIRAQVPWSQLRGTASNVPDYQTADAQRLVELQQLFGPSSSSAETVIFVQRLARYFQQDVMTWVNQPACSNPDCPSNTTNNNYKREDFMVPQGSRPPETQEERQGRASRVEVYRCTLCDAVTRFPRYNAVSKLYETRCGRCGEYANLFGLYCRAMGLETRYVMDWTDHVWVEVHVPQQQEWIMVDACEGVVHQPNMYEQGWGKDLCHIMAFTTTTAVDVTARYTRKFAQKSFCEKRRNETQTSSELLLEQIIHSFNTTTQQQQQSSKSSKPSTSALPQELETHRHKLEQAQSEYYKTLTEWNPLVDHQHYWLGRLSGSTEWKQARHELGSHNHKNDTNTSNGSTIIPPTTISSADRIRRDLVQSVPLRWWWNQSNTTDQSTVDTISLTVNPHASNPYETICIREHQSSVQQSFQSSCAVARLPLLPSSSSSSSYVSVAVFLLPNDKDKDASTQMNGMTLCKTFACTTELDLARVIVALPSLVLVVLVGQLEKPKNEESDTNHPPAAEPDEDDTKLVTVYAQRLGGFQSNLLYPSESKTTTTHGTDNAILYIGQVGAHPDWTVCARGRDHPHGYTLSWQAPVVSFSSSVLASTTACMVQSNGTRPIPGMVVVGRLPNDMIPLAGQVLATVAQKQAAFWKFWQQQQQQQHDEGPRIAGFTSQPGSPVYLLGMAGTTTTPNHLLWSSCLTHDTEPQNHDDDHNKDESTTSWTTCLVLPKVLVPHQYRVSESILEAPFLEDIQKRQEMEEMKKQKEENNKKNAAAAVATFQVPVDMDFFQRSIGSELILPPNSGSATLRVPTKVALENCRLVGLYFSAHWCGPCRSFTPLLRDVYEAWKQERSSSGGKFQNGLEIVFVSSDRDAASFTNYHGSMPWPAMPFEALPHYKSVLSTVYGVQGIPSLVILDAVSGQVVVPASSSRNEIAQVARSRNQHAMAQLLHQWMQQRVPPATIELLQLLEASCHEHTLAPSNEPVSLEKERANSANPSTDKAKAQEDTKDVKETQEEHVSPFFTNTLKQHSDPPQLPLPPGPHNALFQPVASPVFVGQETPTTEMWTCLDKEIRKPLLETLLKYVDNCRKRPWVVKYRRFRASQKLVDRHMTSHSHVLAWLQSPTVGMQVLFQDNDYYVCIPITLDVDALHDRLSRLLKTY